MLYEVITGMAAAVWRGVPTVIHEQNAVLGRANRRLAPKVSRIATAFAEVKFLPKDAEVAMVGMPVRAAIKALRELPVPVLA